MKPLVGALAIALVTGAYAKLEDLDPKKFFGHEICADYELENYQALARYWHALDQESDRIKVVRIGKTAEGRDHWMAIVSDPANLRNLENHRKASERIARAKDFKNDEDARSFIKKTKSVVWIDGGIHSTEVLAHQQLFETTWRLVSAQDEETKRMLKDSIVLINHCNPDGHDQTVDWYMRKDKPEERSLAGLPSLYQKYAGHDTNRDYYQMNLEETRNLNQVLYRQWFPQVVYNHHQTAPQGSIIYIPPFRNPYNYNIDPIITTGTDLVGMHMHQRLISEGKYGTVMSDAASYQAWWNGGMRTTAYFHNMIGILTESFGLPTPTQIPFVKGRQVPTNDQPRPVDPKLWHLRDSLEYSVSANYAILDYASRYRERMLWNVYRAARNSIEAGSRDSWTRTPSKVEEFGAESLSKPELRDPRMYVLTRSSGDFATSEKFANLLRLAGVEVSETTADSGGYPAGSIVVRTDQAFRPHILDMFEAQDYPNEFQYQGGPPKPPYDSAGYTPAFQMGVDYDRYFEPLPLPTKPWDGPKKVAPFADGDDTILAPISQNDSYRLINEALKNGAKVTEVGIHFHVSGANEVLRGVIAATPSGHFAGARTGRQFGQELRKPRVGVLDVYGGSMPSGWTRWFLEEFGFDYEVLWANDLDFGALNDKFDAIILPSGTIPAAIRENASANPLKDDTTIPYYWRRRMAPFSARSLASLKEFAEKGGHIVAIGSSSLRLANHLKAPYANGLPTSNQEFFVPGSLMKVKLRPGPLTRGMPDEITMMFDESPAFKKGELAIPGEVDPMQVGFFEGKKTLMSGWAWGQDKLDGLTAIADVPIGKGRAVLIGPEATFRGQPHASFKLVFNALFRSANK